MRRSPQFAIVSLTFVLLALSASVALAAPSAWQNVDVTRHFEQDGSILLVSGDLPETAKLPAEAELAVPAGSQLQ